MLARAIVPVLVLIGLSTGAQSGRIRGAIDCVKEKDALVCDAMDECVWCVGTQVAKDGYCYPTGAAKLLPRGYFTCDKDASALMLTSGGGRTQAAKTIRADECDKRSEDSCVAPDCVWCTSAAVGGGCYTPAQAKMLPSAIFKCKTAPSA